MIFMGIEETRPVTSGLRDLSLDLDVLCCLVIRHHKNSSSGDEAIQEGVSCAGVFHCYHANIMP